MSALPRTGFVSYAAKLDLDEAFDLASMASEAVRPDSPTAWLPHCSASPSATDEAPVSMSAAFDAALRAFAASQAGPWISAVLVATPASHAKTKERVVFAQTEVLLPQEETVLYPSGASHPGVFELVSSFGTSSASPVRIDLAASKHRFRAVAQSFPGASAASYAALDTSTPSDVVAFSGQPTATAARKEALALLRAAPSGEIDSRVFDVVKISARADSPLARVSRVLLSQRSRAVLHFEEPKQAVRPAGWLFFGACE